MTYVQLARRFRVPVGFAAAALFDDGCEPRDAVVKWRMGAQKLAERALVFGFGLRLRQGA